MIPGLTNAKNKYNQNNHCNLRIASRKGKKRDGRFHRKQQDGGVRNNTNNFIKL